ncbi:ribonuclease P protein component [Cupriavidus sp. P-10]|nr:ribonuclease P protein component [Cupriavidus sp. P-10]
MLYVRANGLAEARLGVVVGKKFAPRAAERNLVKRMARELFRQRRDQLSGRDVLLRLQTKFPRAEFATRAAVRRACAAEIASLLEVAAKPLPPPPVPSATPSAPPAPPPAGAPQSQPPGLPA